MKFILFRSGVFRRQWYFNIEASNGKVIAQSEGYANKGDAISTMDSIRDHIGTAHVFTPDGEMLE